MAVFTLLEQGKIYSGMMRLKNENTLNIRGYVGFSFFERYSSTWTRILDEDRFSNEALGDRKFNESVKVRFNRHY